MLRIIEDNEKVMVVSQDKMLEMENRLNLAQRTIEELKLKLEKSGEENQRKEEKLRLYHESYGQV